MTLNDLQKIIGGYDPSKFGYTYSNDGARPTGWYKDGQDSDNPVASNPYGGGTAFENYLNQNGVRMWDPGNPSYGRLGVTNKQAFDYLNPGATILGTGSQLDGSDPSLGTMQFITGGGAPLGDFFSGKDFGDHSGINGVMEKVGPLLPGLIATIATMGAAAPTLAAGGGSAAADAAGLAQMAADAGLTGQAAADFVTSGGTLGSTAAAGGTTLASAGDSSWGVNGRATTAPMSTMGGQFVDPNTLQLTGGAPMSTTGSLASNSFLPSSAASIGSAPFSLDDFINKRPTTGNKLVDSLLEKAATTALGGANQAGAGSGGDTTGADQQAAEEARKQALIEQINAMYDPNNFTDEEGKLSDAIRGQQGDALKLGYDKAARATTFDAARRGNVGGSVMADNIAGLNRDNQLGATKIEDAVNSALSGLRSARLSSQGNAISLVNAGSGPEGVNAAATGIKNAIDSATAAKVPDVTQGLFQNVALSNQAINTGNNTAALGAYINARTSGGGSLFPLGSRSSGYSVPT